MSDERISLSIEGKIKYRDDISMAEALAILQLLEGAETPPPKREELGQGSASAHGDQAPAVQLGEGQMVADARAALDASGAKTNAEKVVALGQFLSQSGRGQFTIEEVRTSFQRARESVPKNLPRDVTTAVKAGWIAEKEDGFFYVTSRIDGLFSGNFKFPKVRAAQQRPSGRPAKAKAEKPVVFNHIDEVATTLQGYPPYSAMRTNKQKLLWALQYSRENDIDGLTNLEIGWLTDRLGAGIPNKQITATFNGVQRDGHANRSTINLKIRPTEAGSAHLRSLVHGEK